MPNYNIPVFILSQKYIVRDYFKGSRFNGPCLRDVTLGGKMQAWITVQGKRGCHHGTRTERIVAYWLSRVTVE